VRVRLTGIAESRRQLELAQPESRPPCRLTAPASVLPVLPTRGTAEALEALCLAATTGRGVLGRGQGEYVLDVLTPGTQDLVGQIAPLGPQARAL
jgi:hypothetical protein